MNDPRTQVGREDDARVNAPGLDARPIAAPPRAENGSGGAVAWLRSSPFIQLIVYYLGLLVVIVVVTYVFPSTRSAFLSPVILPTVGDDAGQLLSGAPLDPRTSEAYMVRMALERAFATALAILGALALTVPVAGIYMRIKRLQYDPALVRSVVILPIVVAGIALVVKGSLALAFSLAGIVAAVRFRNTLKDPRDAVYIFLVIAIGLSAGVQALDVALVMSIIFNFVVLFLWRFNIGSIYGGRYGETGILSTGPSSLLLAQNPDHRKELRLSLLEEAEEMATDGILLVHAERPEVARLTVQEALSEMAADWQLVRVAPRADGVTTLEYLVQLKEKSAPVDLVGALDERWSLQVEAAEYIPFRVRRRRRGGSAAPTPED